jgi:hypothetical protein
MAGAPTKYNPDYHNETAYKLALLGLTDKEIAGIFDVEEKTLNNWKKSHEEFLQSLKKGKQIADANVASRLYQRACGYEHEEEKIFVHEGQPVRVQTIKHYPPDTAACFIWLKNRKARLWKDKQEVDNKHSGKLDIVRKVIK